MYVTHEQRTCICSWMFFGKGSYLLCRCARSHGGKEKNPALQLGRGLIPSAIHHLEHSTAVIFNNPSPGNRVLMVFQRSRAKQ